MTLPALLLVFLPQNLEQGVEPRVSMARGPAVDRPDLLVSSRFTDEILRYDGATGASLGVFASGGGLDNPVGLTFGPDGDLYVASGDNHRVLRYDGRTGSFRDAFVPARRGGLRSPRQVNFGPDGHLYVASGGTDQVLRYDGTSGAFLGVAAGGGRLDGPTSFTFGPDGHLYVGSVSTNRVKRYHGVTGAYLGNFVTEKLNLPHDVAFGPDGRFYVTNARGIRVRAYDPATGAFLGNYVRDAALDGALGMAWDAAGSFYVVNQGGDEVRRYDAADGTFLESFVSPRAGGLAAPLFLAFMPEQGPRIRIHRPTPGVPGRTSTLGASGLVPGEPVLFLIGATRGLAPMQVCPGVRRALLVDPLVLATRVADEGGRAFCAALAPYSLAGASLWIQVLAPRSCSASEVVVLRY